MDFLFLCWLAKVWVKSIWSRLKWSFGTGELSVYLWPDEGRIEFEPPLPAGTRVTVHSLFKVQ